MLFLNLILSRRYKSVTRCSQKVASSIELGVLSEDALLPLSPSLLKTRVSSEPPQVHDCLGDHYLRGHVHSTRPGIGGESNSGSIGGARRSHWSIIARGF